MFIAKKLHQSVRMALVFGSAATAMSFMASAHAGQAAEQADKKDVERIQVTGSSIKRTDMEGALPVQLINRDDIEKTGLTSAGELIQSLPAMQGFTVAAQSVGGGGGGQKTASLRGLGSEYTLVLLNGRRLAPRGSGSTIDLNSIPLAAIDRIEVLTDGASAIYGSDAIAGVVNFITKSDMQGFNLSARYNKPQQKGGASNNVSASAGFGDFNSDGYNVLVSVSRDSQEQLKSTDRQFSKSGIIPFRYNETDYTFVAGSPNGIPANAQVFVAGSNTPIVFNPYARMNNGCPQDTFAEGTECSWDFTSTIEVFPESVRDNVMVNSLFKVNDDLRVFANLNATDYSETNRVAPYPTGYFPLPLTSPVVQQWVMPNLTPEQRANVTSVNARWRALPVGTRATEWNNKATNVVLGFEGVSGDIDYSGGYTYSVNDSKQNFVGGWLLRDDFVNLMRSGTIDIFTTPDKLSTANRDALMKTVYNGEWTNDKTTMQAVDLKASMPVFELPAGQVYLGTGAEYRKTDYSNKIAEANEQEKILFLSRDTAYDLDRDSYGIFTEAIVPVIENMELSAAVRYDSIGAVFNGATYNEAGFPIKGSSGFVVNEDMSDVTYKMSLKYQATDDLLLRASSGTGFKAPSMLDIAQPRVPAGVTGGSYDCPFAANDPKAAWCLSTRSQYTVFNQGSPTLKPETSEQFAYGFVYAPSKDFSLALDYWRIGMENLVTGLTEAQIFAEAARYYDRFLPNVNKATGRTELAILRSSVNVGKSITRGIDWDVMVGHDLSFGRWSTTFAGTYLLQKEYTRPGTTNDWISSLGRFGANQAVDFRTIAKWSHNLQHGDFNHSVILSYRSGYEDRAITAASREVRLGGTSGAGQAIQLAIPSYTTVNYQTSYKGIENTVLTIGVNNLTDVAPPLSLRGGQGHQTGYDHRYTDAFGRTFYVGVDYSF